MQITPESKKVSELFPISGAVRYRIPDYQRGYSWRNEEIEQLFMDICKEEEGYYVGNILLTGNEDDYSVIDGQQRLTTISLFLLAIGIRFGNDPSKAAIRKQYDIQRQLLCDPENHPRPRITLLSQDQVIYEDYLGLLIDREPKKWGNRSFARRFKFIQELLDDALPTFEQLSDFYLRVMRLDLLRIIVPDLGDAFSVFSSLNSKGLPLTLVDLLI